MRQTFCSLLLTCLALFSCRAAPPKFESVAPLGSARSEDPETARMLANLGSELSVQVCERLRVETKPHFVIWHVPEMPAGGLRVARDEEGNITERRIELGTFMVHNQARFGVAHELVHWYAFGVWDRLPHAVEEGLADYIALQLAPELLDIRKADYGATSVGMTPERRARVFACNEREWPRVSEEVRLDAYAIGYEIVQRLGIDGLRSLCDRAEAEHLERVPVAWLELPPLLETWSREFQLPSQAPGTP